MENSELAFAGQVHGSRVVKVERGGMYWECDALITNVLRTFLCISIADCVPILMFDPASKAVAAVHAGWRGTSAGIIGVAVRRMVEEYAVEPSTVIAYIGPAAGVCCYEVGEDVAGQFGPEVVRREGGKVYLDLKSDNARQMILAGIQPGHIEISPSCTITDGHLFHSYRREREKSGRMMAVIGINSSPSTHRI